jgi:hypothetical protein
MSLSLNVSDHPCWAALKAALIVDEATGVTWSHLGKSKVGLMFLLPAMGADGMSAWRPDAILKQLSDKLAGASLPPSAQLQADLIAILNSAGYQFTWDTAGNAEAADGWLPLIVRGPPGSLWDTLDGRTARLAYLPPA